MADSNMLKFAKNVKETFAKLTGQTIPYNYDMSTEAEREAQVKVDYAKAKQARQEYIDKAKEGYDYYDGVHYTKTQAQAIVSSLGQGWEPPMLNEAFIQVEGQLDEIVPTGQFKARNPEYAEGAKQREKVVAFILYNNQINLLNMKNERRYRITGNGFFKTAWDANRKFMSPDGKQQTGEIVIGAPKMGEMFFDPSAETLEDCEYIIYAYPMHRRKARRVFGKVIDKLRTDSKATDTYLSSDGSGLEFLRAETLLVTEYWYRDEDGDVALSVQIDDKEVRHVPKFWLKTRHSGNQMFPFVHYINLPREDCIWGKGEIELIKALMDSANRELLSALLNNMYMGNDIIVADQGAMPPGKAFDTSPGAYNEVVDGKKVSRLGGVSHNSNALMMIKFIKEKMEEITGNHQSSMGKEPARVVTASGIAQLNERADRRMNKKSKNRLEGYQTLFRLLDWMALEFYDDNRRITVTGGKGSNQTTESFMFNSNDHALTPEPERRAYISDDDELQVDVGETGHAYYPAIDVEVHVGEGIMKSKAFTLAITQELSQVQITPQNAPLMKMVVRLLELPDEQEVLEAIDGAVQYAMEAQQAQTQGAMQPQGQMPPEQPDMSVLNDLMSELSPEQRAFLEEMLANLSPEELEAFLALPNEEQVDAILQAMS